jgi:hypothetical protein
LSYNYRRLAIIRIEEYEEGGSIFILKPNRVGRSLSADTKRYYNITCLITLLAKKSKCVGNSHGVPRVCRHRHGPADELLLARAKPTAIEEKCIENPTKFVVEGNTLQQPRKTRTIPFDAIFYKCGGAVERDFLSPRQRTDTATIDGISKR